MTFLRHAALLALVITGAASIEAQDNNLVPAPGLYGQLRGTTYVAPENRFRIAVPVLPELGGRIDDTENVVTFSDEVSTHVSIACFPLDLSNKWERDTRGIREYLAFFYGEFVFPDFARRFPEAATERMLYTPDLHDGALFAFTLLPGGSAFEARSSVVDTPGSAPAAKRGNLLFVHNDSILILSIELAERVTQRSAFNKTADEENEILRDRLIELAQRMQLPRRVQPRQP
jgi:hypothetical protein